MTASPARIAANRANALKSTGPRTPEGKNRCRLNAVTHAITAQISAASEEEQAAREKFIAEIVAELKPGTRLEAELAHSVADGYWRIHRIRAVEDNIFAVGQHAHRDEFPDEDENIRHALTQARAYLAASSELNRLSLYEQRIQRGILASRAELTKLQTERRRAGQVQTAELNAPQPLPTASIQKDAAPVGSVFSTSQIHPQAPAATLSQPGLAPKIMAESPETALLLAS